MENPPHFLLFSILLIYGLAAPNDPNLASEKAATQSDIYDDDQINYGPELALDGNIISSSFTRTKIGRNKWWMVDLKRLYEVTNVELYNIDGAESINLQKVFILTSNNSRPPNPDPNSQSWRVRYYHDPPYGALGNIILEEGLPAQHVAVFSAHDKGVTLVEVKVYSYKNLAYKCQASQHELYNKYYAKKAVDGILYGKYHFSHTKNSSSWWRVDLGGVKTVAVVELYSRSYELFERFQEMSLWSSAEPAPKTIPDGWSKVSTYAGTGKYDPVAVFKINPNQPIRYLGVTTGHKDNIITLKEVQVFNYFRHNHALGKPATQVDNYSHDTVGPFGYRPGLAVDGSPENTFSHTEGGRGEWWKVDLEKSIIFQYARIHVRSGIDCLKNEDDKTIVAECADRMSDMTYLTNYKDSEQPPKNDTDGWKACMWIKDPLGKELHITCQDGRTPYTRQFAVIGGNKFGVALAEVEVYGYNQPLVKQEGVNVNHKDYRRVEVTILKWTNIKDHKPWIYNTLPTTFNKLRYTLSVDGHNPISPLFETEKSVTFWWPKEKIAGSSGRFEISCLTDEGVCPGPITFGTIEKDAVCTAPDPIRNLNFTKLFGPEIKGNGKRVYRFTTSWKKPEINCDFIHPSRPYIYKLNNGTEMHTTDTKVMIQVDAGTTATFEVKAQNIDNLTSEATTIEIQIPAAASSKPMDLKLTASSKEGCVSFTWKEPAHSNGKITGYQTKCTDKTRWSRPHDSTSAEICGYPAYELVSCTVRANTKATNSGDEATSVSARTPCEVPEPKISHSGCCARSACNDSVTLKVNIAWPLKLHCSYPLLQSDISISRRSTKQVVATLLLSGDGFGEFKDLDGGTNYSVTVKTRNVHRSHETLPITTCETVPKDGPTIAADYTSTCINLNIQSPKHPNGVITEYQYRCSAGKLRLEDVIPVDTLHIANGYMTQICNLPPAHQIICEVRALNQIGLSPPTVNEGYTQAPVSSSQKIEILPADNKQPRSVVIRIFPVTLEDSDLVISSYTVLLMKHTNSQSANDKWTRVAELPNDLVTADGYIFYIGDGKAYGSYINSLMEPGTSYSVKIAIAIQLSMENVSLYQEMKEQTNLTAPLLYCPSSLNIDNSLHNANASKRVGEKMVYACNDGYTKSGGDTVLTCDLLKSYSLYWRGSGIVCTQVLGNEGVYIGAGVGGAVMFFILAIIITVVTIKIKRRSTDAPADSSTSAPASSSDCNPNQDYLQMSPQYSPNYAKLTFVDIPTSEKHHYDNLSYN